MAASTDQDSPLSITSNVVGILTFVAAIEAAIYARVTYLRNSDGKNFRIKTSLSWCKTGSAWLVGLLPALNAQHDDGGGSRRRKMDVEAKASTGSTIDSRFALMPRSWQGGRLSVAMARLPVRRKALELVPRGGIDGYGAVPPDEHHVVPAEGSRVGRGAAR